MNKSKIYEIKKQTAYIKDPKNLPLSWAATGLSFRVKKSQNCVKAAIAFVCTTCKRQLLSALLQKITFVCTIATDN